MVKQLLRQNTEDNNERLLQEELTPRKSKKTNGNLNPVKQVKKVFAEPASKDDIDPVETNEWIEIVKFCN